MQRKGEEEKGQQPRTHPARLHCTHEYTMSLDIYGRMRHVIDRCTGERGTNLPQITN